MFDSNTIYGCILVENNVDEGSRLLLQLEISLEKKEYAKQSEANIFSKIYCLCMKNGHSERIFFRARGAMAPLVPPRSASATSPNMGSICVGYDPPYVKI